MSYLKLSDGQTAQLSQHPLTQDLLRQMQGQ